MNIGIVASVTGQNTVGVPISYVDYIRSYFNATPIALFPDSEIRKDLDLIILPGGADINPMRYGEIPDYSFNPPDLIKEYFDIVILPTYISLNIPIFGICRGMQTLNVHFSGTLYQDMFHETNKKENPFEAVHEVVAPFTGKKLFKVNSRHHQSIKELGEGLRELVRHKDDTIEAFKHDFLPILGVQWHPEDLYVSDARLWLSNELKLIMKK